MMTELVGYVDYLDYPQGRWEFCKVNVHGKNSEFLNYLQGFANGVKKGSKCR